MNKKQFPGIAHEVQPRYAAISKADWAELYFDLYRQTHGGGVTDETIMQDAEKRLAVLKQYRKETN